MKRISLRSLKLGGLGALVLLFVRVGVGGPYYGYPAYAGYPYYYPPYPYYYYAPPPVAYAPPPAAYAYPPPSGPAYAPYATPPGYAPPPQQ
jgi:hypothetical protein